MDDDRKVVIHPKVPLFLAERALNAYKNVTHPKYLSDLRQRSRELTNWSAENRTLVSFKDHPDFYLEVYATPTLFVIRQTTVKTRIMVEI